MPWRPSMPRAVVATGSVTFVVAPELDVRFHTRALSGAHCRPFDPVRGRRGVSGQCRRVPAPLPGGHRSGVRQPPGKRPWLSLAPVVDVSVPSGRRLEPAPTPGGLRRLRGCPLASGGRPGVASVRVDSRAAEGARGSPPARSDACRRGPLRRLHAGPPGSTRRARDSISSTPSRRSRRAGRMTVRRAHRRGLSGGSWPGIRRGR